jgi:ABC-2 type transport system permease protein
MKAFVHHLAYDFRTGIRDRSKLLMLYLFPLVFFFLVGGLMKSINPGFSQTMIPGMMLFAFMCAALLSLPNVLVTAREAGVFRSFRINGVPAASIVTVPVLGTAVHMIIVALIVSLAGIRMYGGVAPTNIGGFVAAAVLSYAAYAGLGVLIGVAAGSGTASILIAQLIYIPSIILGGLMVPSSMLPAGIQRIALLLPASHSMNVFAALGGMPGSHGTPWLSLGVLGASVVLSFGLAALLFEWDTRAAQPSKKAYAALLAIIPFAAAALIGVR